jgi:hypothetical protein
MARGKSSKFRAASISIATPNDDDGYDYSPGGVIFGDEDYPGSGSVLLEIDHPEGLEDDDGYPIRGRAIAINYRFPEDEDGEAEEIAIDIEGSFLNCTFWHEMERSPKAKGGDKKGTSTRKRTAKKGTTTRRRRKKAADDDE